MKIAVATSDNLVSEHFGYCELFRVYNVCDDKIIESEDILNPGHKPGFLPIFLDKHGIDVIISGGMGKGAIDLFNKKDIEIITGASGNTDEIIKMYLSGKLESNNLICNSHSHSNSCGNH